MSRDTQRLEKRSEMTAKVLSPTCLSALDRAVGLWATGSVFGELGRQAKRPGRGDMAFSHRLEVVGTSTRIGGRSIGLDRFSVGSAGLRYRWDDSVQAGGTDSGP